MEQFTQPHASFVQLRLRITYRAFQLSRQSRLLVPLDIVQDKYCAVARPAIADAALGDSLYQPDPSSIKSGAPISMLDELASSSRFGSRFDRDRRW